MRIAYRNLLIVLALIFFAAGALYVGGSAYLNSQAFEKVLLKEVNDRIHGSLSLGGHAVSLLRGRVELRRLALADADGIQVIAVERLFIDYTWLPLLRRSLHVPLFVIEGADVNLAYDSLDRLSLLEIFSPNDADAEEQAPHEASPNWHVRLDDFRIHIDRIRFQRPAHDTEGQGGDLMLNGSFDLAGQTGHVNGSLGSMQWRQAERSFEAEDLAVEFSHDPSLSQPLKAVLRTARSHLSIAARVHWDDAPISLDASADLDVDPADVNPWLPDIARAAGNVRGHIRVLGGMFDPAVSVQLDIGPGSLAGIDIDTLALELGLEKRRITIAAFKSNSAWGGLSLTGDINLQGLFPTDFRRVADQGINAVTYGLILNAENLRPKQMSGYAIPLDGSWQGRISVRGNGIFEADSTGTMDADISVSGVSAGTGAGAFDGKLTSGLHWQGRRFQLTNSRAVVGENQLDLKGILDLSDNQIDVAGKLVCPRLTQVGALTGATVPSGNAAMEFTCRGALAGPSVTARLMAQDLAMEPWTIGRLMALAELDTQGVVRISDLVLENQGSLIQGSGRLGPFQSDGQKSTDPGVWAELRFEQLQVSDFGPYPDIKGGLSGSLALNGTLGNPQAVVTLDDSPVGWGDIVGQVRGTVRWDGGRLIVDTLSLAKGNSTLGVAGSVEFRDHRSGNWLSAPRIVAHAESEGIELSDVHPDSSGRLSMTADVEGPADDLAGSFRLGGRNLSVAGQPISGGDLQGRLAGQRVVVDNVDINLVEDQRLGGSGWYGFNREFSLKIATNGLDVKHIAALQHPYPVQGLLVFDLNGGGSIDRPDIRANLSLRRPRLNDQPFDDFSAGLQLVGNELNLSADLNFHLRAHLQTDSGDYSLNAAFSQTDLTPYLALLAGPKWGGSLSGTLRAAGNRSALQRSEARLALSMMKLTTNGVELVAADSLQLDLKNGEISLPATRIRLLQTGYLDVHATGPLVKDVQAGVDGRLPLAALAPFTEALADVGGQVVLHGRTRGPVAAPVWQADLDLEQVSFELPQFSQEIDSLNGTIHLSPESISVEDVAGTVDSGRFELHGAVTLSDMVPNEGALQLRLYRLPLQWPGTMEAVFNGELTLAGNAQGADLAGKLVLVEGSYYKNVRLDLLSTLTETRRAREVPVFQEKPPWMRRIAVDVQLRHRNPFLVDNNLARLEIAPDLHCGGNLGRPVLTGRATVGEGELYFRGKTFEVKRGVVDFVNPNRIEPTVDILGETRIRQWLVSLAVAGTPDRLVFSLSSDPPEADNDILSLILIGRTNKEMIEGEGGGRTTTRQMLAQLIATAYGEDIKKTAGVDILELETGSQNSDTDDPNRIQVTVGKKLSRRLTVKYSVESEEGEMIQRAVSEYRFLEHVLASGFQDDKGKYGGELLYRLEFR